jgi:exodeoxyribonuclease V beta subunit
VTQREVAKPMKPLDDVTQLPLTGAHLLQASAGTGKTWTLCSIVLRLLLERGLRLDQVLVVTFTRAATDELRSRLRERLELAQQALSQPLESMTDSSIVDPKLNNDVLPFLRHARQQVPQDTLKARVDQALGAIDDAAVHTIHAFFHRSLKAAAFSAGQSVELTLEGNDQVLRATALADAWRTHVDMGALDPALISTLYAHRDSPVSWAPALDELLKSPMAVVNWQDAQPWDPRMRERIWPALESQFERLKSLWTASHAELREALDQAVVDGRLRGDWRNAAVRRVDEVLAWVQQGDPLVALTAGTVSSLLKGPLKNHDAVQALLAVDTTLEPLRAHLAQARMHLAQTVLTQAANDLRQAKRRSQTLGYDDLLHDMLLRLQAQPGLADALRERHPAALIDEFQDTDAVQLAVFDAIYPAHTLKQSMLVLVGDPKQSIYAFRGADLASYLSVFRRGIPVHTLAVNHRSTPQLVDATNALLTQHETTLGEPDIQPTPVKAGKALLAPAESASERGAALSWISVPPPQDDHLLTARDAKAWAATVCARWIAHELAASSQVNPVAGGDIAVLVQTHHEGAAMRDALTRSGVASLDRSRSSVFVTRTAAELSLILRAVLDPSHDGAVRAALATQALGATAQELEASASSNASASKEDAGTAALHAPWLEWKELWERRGVASMLGRLQHDVGLVQRILPLPFGERWMTDWMHLIDLLGEAEQSHRSLASLSRWLEQQRANPRHTEERTDDARLDSERALVKIVTVHASKGLQYPIVVLPFLWVTESGQHKDRRRSRLDMLTFHDKHNRLSLGFFLSKEEAAYKDALSTVKHERRLEQLRKFYVALTRAERRCVLVHDVHARMVGTSTKPNLSSELNWLVAGYDSFAGWQSSLGSGKTKSKASERALVDRQAHIEKSWQKLVASKPGLIDMVDGNLLMIQPVPRPRASIRDTGTQSQSAPLESQRIAAFPAHGPHGSTWWPTSFTSLSRRLEADDEPTRALSAAPSAVPLDDFLRFPRGSAAGITFHAAVERADLSRPATWDQAATAALRMHPLGAMAQGAERNPESGEPGPSAHAMLMQALRNLSTTPLLSPKVGRVQLSDVAPGERSNELGFEMALSMQNPAALARTVDTLGLPVPPFAPTELQALSQCSLSLRGFIDQVFLHEGRYHLLDWKTNALGWTAQDHDRQAIEACMHEHGYHLQHVLYAVALWRELVARLGRDAANAAWGGTFILFVRGVRPEWVQSDGSPCGVFHRRLDADSLDLLSDVLGVPS